MWPDFLIENRWLGVILVVPEAVRWGKWFFSNDPYLKLSKSAVIKIKILNAAQARAEYENTSTTKRNERAAGQPRFDGYDILELFFRNSQNYTTEISERLLTELQKGDADASDPPFTITDDRDRQLVERVLGEIRLELLNRFFKSGKTYCHENKTGGGNGGSDRKQRQHL